MEGAVWDRSKVGATTEIRVRVADTDLMGVVYNSNYLIWFEVGRTELIRSRGISYAEVESRGYSLPVIEARFVVRRPARYDDLLQIETRIGQRRSRKVSFLYRICRDAELLVEGETLHVPVAHEGGRATSLPPWLARALDCA
jgi:acyl-CoA thioester hydrolase